MPARTVTASRNRLAATALMATRDRLSAQPAALAAVAAPQEASIVTVPTSSPAPRALDLAAFLAQGQELLALLQPAAKPAAAPAAPAAPAQSAISKAQAFWQSDYEGKGVPVRQLSNGRWVDSKGAFCKGPKAPAKTQKPATAPSVAAIPSVPAGPGISLAQLERLLAALGGEPVAPVAATPAPVAAPVATGSVKDLLVADGEGWLHCPVAGCTAYWSANREEAFLAAKVAKHNRKHAA